MFSSQEEFTREKMSSRRTTREKREDMQEAEAAVNTSKQRRPLSTLRNPTWEFLHRNYTKAELQKFGNDLQLRGLWVTKEKLIDKLMTYYTTQQEQTSDVVADRELSLNQEREGEVQSQAELMRKFEQFVRETSDNFYVINNSLKEKDREIEELKNKDTSRSTTETFRKMSRKRR